jgi:hypothetical protein
MAANENHSTINEFLVFVHYYLIPKCITTFAEDGLACQIVIRESFDWN